MPRRALLVLALAAAGLASPGAAAAALPPAKAVLVACERGVEAADRAGVFEGDMRTVPGAVRMQMRFRLEARTPGHDRWVAVAAPGFGTWVSSAAGTARYVYTKRVENLLSPASYRVQVRFRWLDPAAAVLKYARAYSATCRQPDRRANLVVGAIDADAARRSYSVLVRNDGRSAAGPSALSLAVDGRPLPAAAVPELAPGGSLLVTFEGPACTAGSPLIAGADAQEAVDERDEADNRFSRPCPAPS